jgi:hypothetical protein
MAGFWLAVLSECAIQRPEAMVYFRHSMDKFGQLLDAHVRQPKSALSTQGNGLLASRPSVQRKVNVNAPDSGLGGFHAGVAACGLRQYSGATGPDRDERAHRHVLHTVGQRDCAACDGECGQDLHSRAARPPGQPPKAVSQASPTRSDSRTVRRFQAGHGCWPNCRSCARRREPRERHSRSGVIPMFAVARIVVKQMEITMKSPRAWRTARGPGIGLCRAERRCEDD